MAVSLTDVEPGPFRELLSAAVYGDLAAVNRLLAADPGLALKTNRWLETPLQVAASCGNTAVVQALLAAAPQAALARENASDLPLHMTVKEQHEAVVKILVEANPATALMRGSGGTPLDLAVENGHEEAVAALLAAAPEAARGEPRSFLPIHAAAEVGFAGVVQLLLAAAPETATATTAGGQTPLQLALRVQPIHQRLKTARCLLGAGPAAAAIQALSAAGPEALPLFTDLVVARPAQTAEEWALLPTPCPDLGTALPAVLERSVGEAALLVAHLPAEERQRLRSAALCLGRAQRASLVHLPTPLVWRVLALAATGAGRAVGGGRRRLAAAGGGGGSCSGGWWRLAPVCVV